MRVTLVARGASEFTIEVSLQQTILEIKQIIQQVLGVPVTSQTLTVSGWELLDGLDLEDYPIVTEGTKIDLAMKCTTQPHLENGSKILIVLEFSSRKINIEVDHRTETVRSLKEKIHIIDGTPIKRMALSFSGRAMDEDFRNLSEYGICEFSEIAVFLKPMSRLVADPPSRRLGLVVQTSSSLLDGASIPLEMKDSSTVNELRQVLLVRKILPMDDYIFIHKQRIMRDNRSLRSYGVENGDCLYVFKGTVSREGY
ncbi:polyubiquitin 8 [Rhododendron vialii]|uniref:polyubiquitin 8 n=1 Tax=Rhododendron vialii TaxID=182163 RepID=UPI00265DB24C|nr:polyubiquitin 8 [Rhododendron vialii]